MKIIPRGILTTEDISKLESEFEITLPQDYKEFLLTHNGGRPEISYAEFYIEYLEEYVYLVTLYDINDVSEYSNMWPGDIPLKSIIIGRDTRGGQLLLIADGEEDGLYYYDQAYTFEQSNDDSNTYFIANTFTEFIDSLKVTNDEG